MTVERPDHVLVRRLVAVIVHYDEPAPHLVTGVAFGSLARSRHPKSGMPQERTFQVKVRSGAMGQQETHALQHNRRHACSVVPGLLMISEHKKKDRLARGGLSEIRSAVFSGGCFPLPAPA